MNAILKEKSEAVKIEDDLLMCQLFYFLTILKEIILGIFLCSIFWKRNSLLLLKLVKKKILFDYSVANIKAITSEFNSHWS